MTTRLILVGGFLGAGKTTLLWQAARGLAARGKRVGLITNDQAPDLVDTGFLAGQGLAVREVTGSCFCCNFAGLISAAEGLAHDLRADVLIAEPVGSCTDLSATILQPLKDKFAHEFVLAPFSVLADAVRLREVLTRTCDTLHASAAYIYRKQLEEADIIVVNKIDLVAPEALEELKTLMAAQFPQAELRAISALNGQGVEAWLDSVLAARGAGRRIADVDYEVYAEGEAVLGWLNASIRLASSGNADWRGFCVELLQLLQQAFREKRADVAHVKLLLSALGGHYAASLTRTDGDIRVRGDMGGSPTEAGLILNARVEMSPPQLEAVVREAIVAACGTRIVARVEHLKSLSPGRPSPTYRYTGTVERPSGQ
jgi:Ni2+-binding GTPase involved in maturation of urease and hydrogenase